ncbi:peptidyl-trna hydrolase protein [Apiospora phragmitis]|uniref:Peptidyl-trna hydrolase protein n=1 Tax=Apiospora phragmitis TaxID=2905665 RepID=A0ABR1WTT1_9PEZI
MRFSVTSAALLALPALASAEVPEYQAQFQQYLGKFKSYIPSHSKTDPVHAAEAKPGSTTPEEYWVFVTGGNKTCFGHCGKIEQAFNETAGKFALLPDAPHTGYLNCEHEPVLCNSWSVPTGTVWVFEMLPEPAPIDIWVKRFNLTTTTSDDIVARHAEGYKKTFQLHEGTFHPFNGWWAQNHLSLPVGYVLWFFNVVPSWLLMLVLSFVSRSMMSNRMAGQQGGAPRPAATGQAVPR